MLYTVSYAEEMKVGWRKFDTAIWENLQRTFKIDKHFVVGNGNLNRLEDVREHLDEHEDRLIRYVNVQPPSFFVKKGEQFRWLEDFLHPADACYIFGSNQQELESIVGRNVSIQLKESTLFSFCAAAIVLNDRYSSRLAQW